MTDYVTDMRKKAQAFWLWARKRRRMGVVPGVDTSIVQYLHADSTEGFYSADALGEPYTPAAWGVVFRMTGSNAGSYLCSYANGGLSNGYGIRQQSASQLGGHVGDGAWKASPYYNLANIYTDGLNEVDANVWHAVLVAIIGGYERMWLDGVEQGNPGTAVGAMTAPSGTDRLAIGGWGTGLATYAPDADIAGFIANDTAPSVSEIADWFDAVRAVNGIAELARGTNYVYDARDVQSLEDWAEKNGAGVTLVKRSSPTVGEDGTPLWNFGGGNLTDYTEAAFVRASEADVYDGRGAGAWYHAESGEALIAADGAVYVQGERTNQVSHYIPGQGGFAVVGGGTATTDDDTAPDGALEATKFETSATSHRFQQGGITTANIALNDNVAFSVWMKGAAGGEKVRLRYQKSDGTSDDYDVVLTTSWVRYEHRSQNSATDTGNQLVQIRANDSAAQTFHVWGAQVEVGKFASSLIKATSAGGTTRYADTPSYTNPAGAVLDRGFVVTFACSLSSSDLVTLAKSGYVLNLDNNNYLSVLEDGTGVKVRCRGTVNAESSYITFDAFQEVTVTVDWENDNMNVAGATTGNGDTSLASLSAWGNTTTLKLGSTGSIQHLYGFISPLRSVAA